MRSLMICFLMLAACGDGIEKAPRELAQSSSSLPNNGVDTNTPPERKCQSITAIVGNEKIFVPSSCAPAHVDVDGDPALNRDEIDPRHDLPSSIQQDNTL